MNSKITKQEVEDLKKNMGIDVEQLLVEELSKAINKEIMVELDKKMIIEIIDSKIEKLLNGE
jgi:hypothetical protein